MDSWRTMVRAQGGDPAAPLAQAPEREQVLARRSGYVAGVDAMAIGVAAWLLGAGRARKEDPVSAGAGVILHKRPGDRVKVGDVLYELRADDAARIPGALEAAAKAVTIARAAPTPVSLVIDRIAAPRRRAPRKARV
jgi:thymidine phosphorylase